MHVGRISSVNTSIGEFRLVMFGSFGFGLGIFIYNHRPRYEPEAISRDNYDPRRVTHALALVCTDRLRPRPQDALLLTHLVGEH